MPRSPRILLRQREAWFGAFLLPALLRAGALGRLGGHLGSAGVPAQSHACSQRGKQWQCLPSALPGSGWRTPATPAVQLRDPWGSGGVTYTCFSLSYSALINRATRINLLSCQTTPRHLREQHLSISNIFWSLTTLPFPLLAAAAVIAE